MKYNGDLFANYNRAEKIGFVKAGDSIEVRAYSEIGKTYLVEINDTTGWVYEGNVNSSYDLLILREDTKAQKNKGKYWVGMSNSDATMNLGLPTKVTKRYGTWGVTETWYFKEYGVYLVLDNDKVTAIFYDQ